MAQLSRVHYDNACANLKAMMGMTLRQRCDCWIKNNIPYPQNTRYEDYQLLASELAHRNIAL
jgi:hypothetical protein